MKALMAALFACIGFALVAPDAEARRFGGGKNLGMQRSAPTQQKAAPPAQQQQPAQQNAQATPPQQPQPSGMSKWLGPLAGLALGAGIAALFLNNGMAGVLAGLLVLGLIAGVLFFIGRALLGRQPARPLQYAGGPEPGPIAAGLPGDAAPHSVAATTRGAAPEFDRAEFLRHAKLNFVRLQEAHDNRDLSAMRDFLAPDVYREIEADLQSSWGAEQKTQVEALDAEVVDLAEEGASYIASVRFSGSIREAADRDPEPFTETWHLEKPVNGRGGWVVAGIQQS